MAKVAGINNLPSQNQKNFLVLKLGIGSYCGWKFSLQVVGS